MLAAVPAQAQDAPLLVFAAASLKNALDDVNGAYEQKTGRSVTTSYAASSALARQIEQGAPADVFISADLEWMDYLSGRGLVDADSRLNLLGNRLVLIAPDDSSAEVDIVPHFPLAALLGDGRLAMADTEAVPAGRYGKAALQELGLWEAVRDRLAQAENVRAALLLVSRGEAPLGIVYRTDAAVEPAVRILGTFPEDTHPPIVYPAAVTRDSEHPHAAGYVTFLRSASAQAVFAEHGFTLVD